MHLDRFFRHSERRRDLLIKAPGDNMAKNFKFPLGKLAEALLRVAILMTRLAPLPIPFQSDTDRVQKYLIIDRLCQKVDGTRLHRSHAIGDIPLPGQKDNGSVIAVCGKYPLQFKAIHVATHRQVEHCATRRLRVVLLKEAFGRKIAARREARPAQKPL